MWLDGIIGDPVRRALRAQLKELGQRLFNLVGDIGHMRDIAEEVAEQRPESREYRIDIIARAWDGVGKGGVRWWV